jgi:hypothetical protein
MLADQFAAAAAARNTYAVDEIARLTWRAHAEGQLAEAEATAISEAIAARRAAFATGRAFPFLPPSPTRPTMGHPKPARRPPRSPARRAKRPSGTHRQTKPERARRIIEIDQMVTGFWRSGRGSVGWRRYRFVSSGRNQHVRLMWIIMSAAVFE